MRTLDLIQRIFAQPTAPFRENYVLDELRTLLKEHKIPYFVDSVGQIIAGVSKKQQLLKKQYIAFVAHTDHPGFIMEKKISQGRYQAMWYGGAPFQQMENSKVRIHSYESKKHFKGVIKNLVGGGNHREGIPCEIQTKSSLSPKDSFGAFDFDGFKIKNNLIKTKCADDLAGCVMALGALIDLKKHKKNVIAVFTRAEEVGFIGCLNLIRSKILPSKTLIVSLEASRTLPGALLGEGPVVRLGDASTLFDSKMSLFMSRCAQNLKQKDKNFKFQKRIMDGGSCEATAFSQWGYQTMGLAVPLDNYHNMGKKGPAPEIIHLEDVENGRKLLVEVGQNLKLLDKTSLDLQKRLMTNYRSLHKMLDK